MLEETYEKFKLQLKSKKSGNEQLPEVVEIPDVKIHHICSYNHYRVKDSDIKRDKVIMMSMTMMS